MPRLQAGGDKVFWKKIIIRSLLIYLIGLFLTWWPFVQWKEGHFVFRNWVDPNNPESGVRLLGVLARIAICYFFASIIIYYFKPKAAFFIGLLLLLLYWVLCFLLGDQNDPYSMSGWFGNRVDKAVLGVAHMYKGEGMPFDPEGIMSTMPAIVQVIFGFMVGDYIQKKGKSFEMLVNLFVAAVALLITGWCWDLVFPINKKIWTSSYVVYTTGLAILALATMIFFIEFKNIRNWLTRFFAVFGKNALFIFALSAFIPKGLALLRLGNGVNPWNWLYKKVLINVLPADPRFGSFLYAISVILFMWAIAWWMDRKRIYVKV
jgi:predicted acyltransferase